MRGSMRNEVFLHRAGQCSVRVIYDNKEGRIYDRLILSLFPLPLFFCSGGTP